MSNTEDSPHSELVVDSLVLETAAHIPQDQFPDYQLVWSDEETDRAVYIRINYEPQTTIVVGDECLLGAIPVTVTDTDSQGVYLSLGDTFAEHGMSGTPVTYNGIPFAFVSRATSVNSVYAVFY